MSPQLTVQYFCCQMLSWSLLCIIPSSAAKFVESQCFCVGERLESIFKRKQLLAGEITESNSTFRDLILTPLDFNGVMIRSRKAEVNSPLYHSKMHRINLDSFLLKVGHCSGQSGAEGVRNTHPVSH